MCSLPLPKRGRTPKFSAHVYCGQTAGWMKLVRGIEVGLSPGDFVLDGDAAPPPKKGAQPQIFGPCLLWPNGWMDQDGTWHGGRAWSRPHCARWRPSSPLQKGGRAPYFPPIYIVSKRLDASRCQLGMELGLGPGDFVFAPPPEKGADPQIFGPCLLWPNGWMDEAGTWH